MMKNSLSKSNYLDGLNCKKSLWLSLHKIELCKDDDFKDYRFEIGNKVGLLAREYFGKGFQPKSPYYEVENAFKETFDYINDGGKLIYEGVGFNKAEGIFALADILIKDNDSWELIEVKSSTGVKDYHVEDLSFQNHVFKSLGLNVTKLSVLHLNKNYQRGDQIDVNKLFLKSDVTKKVLQKGNIISLQIAELIETLSVKNEPIVDIGSHCKECQFKEYCWKGLPKYNIYNVFSAKKAEEVHRNNNSIDIKELDIKDYPKGNKLVDVNSYLSGDVFVNKKEIKKFLDTLIFPYYFLDFETFGPAIPIFKNSKPYENIPFQFSLHIQENENSEIKHVEYISKDKKDFRLEFAETLLKSIKKTGSVIVYNQSFEKNVISSLSDIFPEIKHDLLKINERMIDLLRPFRSRHLYSPKQNGSASIKAVLPTFTNESYDDLEIQGGMEVSINFEKYFLGELKKENVNIFFNNALKYCKLDTLAMYKLLKVLQTYV